VQETDQALADPTRRRIFLKYVRGGERTAADLDHRHEARRMQYRFRKSPEYYLTALEEKLSKERLPP